MKKELVWFMSLVGFYIFYYTLLDNLYYALLCTTLNALLMLIIIDNIYCVAKKVTSENVYRIITSLLLGININLFLIGTFSSLTLGYLIIMIICAMLLFIMGFFKGFCYYIIDKIIGYIKK